MLLNLSNHPYSTWPVNQIQTAKDSYTEIRDLSFPNIPPQWNSEEVDNFAGKYLYKVLAFKPQAVHIMGEHTFCFALVNKLKAHGIVSLASTTTRNIQILPDGRKISNFQFVRFRPYV